MSEASTPVHDATITDVVLEAARDAADRAASRPPHRPRRRPALVDPAGELGHADFARAVPAAADGLRRHGVRHGDVGAVHVRGVRELAVAAHAVTAAGAVPVLLPPGGGPAGLAGMMNEAGARFLLTGEDTAAVSMAAVEGSYVRQVFAFGDVPGATPFRRLLEPGAAPAGRPLDPLRGPALRVPAPGEDITHADRLADLYRRCGTLGISDGDVLALCGQDVPAPMRMGLVDLCLMQGATLVGVPGRDTGDLLEAILGHRATAAVVTPAKLRAIAFDHGRVPVPGVRLLVTGAPSAEAVHACRVRHRWPVALLC
ncbi:AMP-binding protein [Actinomadura luteofluorescens]|uniref:AMP-binding protein n=1 Tax=Actinomadura luteofluorescens TaxID=46163 RepID=UPI00347003BF